MHCGKVFIKDPYIQKQQEIIDIEHSMDNL